MVWNEKLKREIPLGWSIRKIDELVSVSKETLNPQDNPNVSYLHFSLPSFDKTGGYSCELGKEIQSNKFTVCEKDVLVSKLNPWFSRVISVGENGRTICSTEFVVWRTNSDAIKNCLFLVAKTPPFIEFCTRAATGTSNSHKRVSPEIMVSYQIPYDDSIYNVFGHTMSPILQSINTLKVVDTQLAETRDFLLPMLMNGQCEVAK